MRLVIFSSTSGLDIAASMANLLTHGTSQGVGVVGPLKVEDACLEVAAPLLVRLYPGMEPTLARFLTLPLQQICDCCRQAFRLTVEAARKKATDASAEFAFISFHPVLFHQRTTGFIEPYQGADLKAALSKDVAAERVVSIHDDIYDMYRRLLGPRLLFDPSLTRPGQRRPLQDFQELMLLLEWRDRELSAALSIAQGLGSRHFLFHAKGRTRSLWEAVCEDKPAVYLSHPISQPRRDILGIAHPEKSLEPDGVRGRKLIEDCVQLSDLLSKFAPVVEPTAIDELRLDFDRFTELRESDLKESVLPALTERWPEAQDQLLCGQSGAEEFEGLTRIPADRFKGCQFSDDPLGDLVGAARLVAEEMRRQINVRDHLLAEQAGLVVAFRPFSLPDSPAPTGGVRKEVDVIMRKVALGQPTCQPGIIIIHPPDDERRRRANEFGKAWGWLARKFLAEPLGATAQQLEQKCSEVLLDAPSTSADQEIVSSLSQAIAEAGVRLRPLAEISTSMSSHGIVREEEAAAKLATELVADRSILRSKLEEDARTEGTDVILLRLNADLGVEFAQLVRDIVEKGLRDG